MRTGRERRILPHGLCPGWVKSESVHVQARGVGVSAEGTPGQNSDKAGESHEKQRERKTEVPGEWRVPSSEFLRVLTRALANGTPLHYRL